MASQTSDAKPLHSDNTLRATASEEHSSRYGLQQPAGPENNTNNTRNDRTKQDSTDASTTAIEETAIALCMMEERMLQAEAPNPNPRLSGLRDHTRHTHHPQPPCPGNDGDTSPRHRNENTLVRKIKDALISFARFIGPGFMVSVAYIDPGNYATAIAAGASYRFSLLFVVLLANFCAVFLQVLAAKLGTVSGLSLAEASRRYLPRWVGWGVYIVAEGAVVATDVAEVIGFAIALNLLIPSIPLVAGCALSILEVLLILLLYSPTTTGTSTGRPSRALQAFEYIVMLLVLAVIVCFCVQLSMIRGVDVGDVLKGFVPSGVLLERTALYQACGILGATVMPHSLYLGSGIVQGKVLEWEKRAMARRLSISDVARDERDGVAGRKEEYRPSLAAIRHSLRNSTLTLTLSLTTLALFVNASILIVAGASLYPLPSDSPPADLFTIHTLLTTSLSPLAGTLFALSLLLSGASAGIVCTLAGQILIEGSLPSSLLTCCGRFRGTRGGVWVRRLVIRCISLVPSIVVASAVGRKGVSAALEGSQVALSVALPVVGGVLVWLTGRKGVMTAPGHRRGHREEEDGERVKGERERAWERVRRWLLGERRMMRTEGVTMANSWWVVACGLGVWLAVTGLNVANLVLMGKGGGGEGERGRRSD